MKNIVPKYISGTKYETKSLLHPKDYRREQSGKSIRFVNCI